MHTHTQITLLDDSSLTLGGILLFWLISGTNKESLPFLFNILFIYS